MGDGFVRRNCVCFLKTIEKWIDLGDQSPSRNIVNSVRGFMAPFLDALSSIHDLNS